MTDDDHQAVSAWMLALGFHLEQDRTPSGLRDSKHWVSNDDPGQRFYPASVPQDLAAEMYRMSEVRVAEAREDLLFDLDEIDNKPWRVFRQLAKIMPEYADTYRGSVCLA